MVDTAEAEHDELSPARSAMIYLVLLVLTVHLFPFAPPPRNVDPGDRDGDCHRQGEPGGAVFYAALVPSRLGATGDCDRRAVAFPFDVFRRCGCKDALPAGESDRQPDVGGSVRSLTRAWDGSLDFVYPEPSRGARDVSSTALEAGPSSLPGTGPPFRSFARYTGAPVER